MNNSNKSMIRKLEWVVFTPVSANRNFIHRII